VKDLTLCFVLGTPLREMMGTEGGGELSVCKIPARQKFNCSASELTSPPQFDSRQGIRLLVQCLWALLKGQD